MKVLYFVVDRQTSCSVWHTLEQALTSMSNSHIIQFHGSLQDLRQGDESVTQFMQKAKALFNELAAAGRPVSLEDFNLYVFRGLQGEFKALVTSLVTKTEPLSYADLHSHLLMHKFLHKTSITSMRSATINAPLLPTLNTLPSTFVSQRQSSRNFSRYRGHFHGGWRPNQFSSRGNRFVASRPDFRSLHSSSNIDGKKGNWQSNRGQNKCCQLCQTFGHTTLHCPQPQHRGYGQQPSANLVLSNVSSTGTVD